MKVINSSKVNTERIKQHLITCGDKKETTILFIHGNASSSVFWKNMVKALPDSLYCIAPDLRGFGNTEDALIDATRGMRDFADDIIALLKALDIDKCHVVGHSMGGSVIYSLVAYYPEYFSSVTLVNPGSPYGFGGTKDLHGTPHWPDFAGSGGGVVNPEFARRISIGDRTSDDPVASPRVVMNSFYWKPPFRPENEEELLDGLLSEKVGPNKYPGDFVPSANFPNTAPGVYGPPNALSPKYIGDSVERFIENIKNIPVCWIRGSHDQIVSDNSLFDLGVLGKMGFIPGYPGEAVYPPQPMVGQTRAVLQKAAAKGAQWEEIVMEDTGHTPYIEKQEEFLHHFLKFLNRH